MPRIPSRRNTQIRTAKVAFQGAPFESAIAVATLVSCLVYLIDTNNATPPSISHTARELTPYWEALYGVSGALVLCGLAASLRLEAAGLCLLIAAVVIQAVSIVDFAGLPGVATMLIFTAIATAAMVRIYTLYRLWSPKAPPDAA
jgi:hypothetical protein